MVRKRGVGVHHRHRAQSSPLDSALRVRRCSRLACSLACWSGCAGSSASGQFGWIGHRARRSDRGPGGARRQPGRRALHRRPRRPLRLPPEERRRRRDPPARRRPQAVRDPPRRDRRRRHARFADAGAFRRRLRRDLLLHRRLAGDDAAGDLHGPGGHARKAASSPQLDVAEYGPKGPWWYDILSVRCSGPGDRCNREAADAWSAEAKTRKRGRIEPCGSTVISHLRWDTSGGTGDRELGCSATSPSTSRWK